jgi:hypothetical protein
MTLALSVEPICFPLLIGVKDMSSERFWGRRGCRWWNDSLDRWCGRRSWRRKMLADHWGFADPLLKRLFPGQRDERGGEDDFDEEAHFFKREWSRKDASDIDGQAREAAGEFLGESESIEDRRSRVVWWIGLGAGNLLVIRHGGFVRWRIGLSFIGDLSKHLTADESAIRSHVETIDIGSI